MRTDIVIEIYPESVAETVLEAVKCLLADPMPDLTKEGDLIMEVMEELKGISDVTPNSESVTLLRPPQEERAEISAKSYLEGMAFAPMQMAEKLALKHNFQLRMEVVMGLPSLYGTMDVLRKAAKPGQNPLLNDALWGQMVVEKLYVILVAVKPKEKPVELLAENPKDRLALVKANS